MGVKSLDINANHAGKLPSRTADAEVIRTGSSSHHSHPDPSPYFARNVQVLRCAHDDKPGKSKLYALVHELGATAFDTASSLNQGWHTNGCGERGYAAGLNR